LEDAARTLGARGLDRFATITLPLMLPGIIAGVITSFSAALGEFGAVITFVSNIPGENPYAAAGLLYRPAIAGGEHAAARLAGFRWCWGWAVCCYPNGFTARAPDVGALMLAVAAAAKRGAFALDVRFELPTPGVAALFGRSGSGKSMGHAIAGLLEPDVGRIVHDESVLLDTQQKINVPPECRRMGYVFQDARLFPHLSVAGNLRYAERRAGGTPYVSLATVTGLLDLGR